jgi:hypothetical protein
MGKDLGFIKLPRSLLEQGKMSHMMAGVYVVVLLQADRSTGLWWGSSRKLAATGPRGNNVHNIQRALESLEKQGYIRRFMSRTERGNYPVLVNRYLVTDGALSGRRLNADKSSDWKHLVYEDYDCTGTELVPSWH